ncbi:MAG: hypothetical protein GXP49_16960 [Deltaproteobacteria bacterium]|nr:hypothetical protein [Deltaproteobacteria bacterium]
MKVNFLMMAMMGVAVFAVSCGNEPASPRIGVKTKLCVPEQQCDSADSYFLTFYSSLAGDYKVSVHDSAGKRWATVSSGSVASGEEKDVTVHSDDIPGDGSIIRITVVTGNGGIGRVDCPVGPDWETKPCR